MREILFRGKRMDNGEWVEGAYFKHDTVRVCLSSDDSKPKHLIVKDGFCDWGFEPGIVGIEVDPSTVGQYTGLIDRDGAKVFEGDIVEVDAETLSCIFVVKYGGFRPAIFHDLFNLYQGFRPKGNCFGLYFDSTKEQMIPVDSKFLKVIGNVHDDRLEDFDGD